MTLLGLGLKALGLGSFSSLLGFGGGWDGHPLTSCWSKGQYKEHPYYLCRQKGCQLYGKSISRDKAEEDFQELLKQLTPAPGMIDLMLQVIEEAKKMRMLNYEDAEATLKKEQQLIDLKIEQLVDRIVATDSQVLVATYERQIKQLEEKRIITDEKIRNCGTVDHTLGNINRTFLQFLQNPHEFWLSSDFERRRTVLKVTLASPVAYSKKEGYRTPALAQPFSVWRGFSDTKSGLVVPRGVEPPTNSLGNCCSIQLSYGTTCAESSPAGEICHPQAQAKIFIWVGRA